MNAWLDILVIGVMIYIVIRLLFEARSLSVAIGIIALALLYWLSGVFNLPLTNLTLKTFFGFLIIFIAIIFQGELRRLFSFVGFFSFQRGAPADEATIETIAQAVARLSREKVGALIVFPGKESVSRHFEKGISLGGDLSQELLLSIFSEETPGHDGALIIENNKITQFGVHLPLTQNTQNLGHFGGLRHRAAMGLSERSDAFVIVVSGETGDIDVAHNRAWEHCKTAAELQAKLAEFSKNITPKNDGQKMVPWLERNALMFLVSLVISGTIWVIVSPEFAPTQRNFTVPLEFLNVPSGYVVQDAVPRDVVITLQGKNSDFATLSAESLDVSLDLSGVKNAGWVTAIVSPKEINAPANFSAIEIAPQSVQVDIIQEKQ